MRNAPVSNQPGGRLTSYWEFQARRLQKAEPLGDIVEFELVEEPESTIEVEEKQFESWDELFAHVKQVMGELE